MSHSCIVHGEEWSGSCRTTGWAFMVPNQLAAFLLFSSPKSLYLSWPCFPMCRMSGCSLRRVPILSAMWSGQHRPRVSLRLCLSSPFYVLKWWKDTLLVVKGTLQRSRSGPEWERESGSRTSLSHIYMYPIRSSNAIIRGEGAKPLSGWTKHSLSPMCSAGRNRNGATTVEHSSALPQKVKRRIHYHMTRQSYSLAYTPKNWQQDASKTSRMNVRRSNRHNCQR